MTYRIQKLLFSDYSDFEDTVLVESPFAETTREGEGVRQVQIGLTPTKFIVASYYVQPADEAPPPRAPSVDGAPTRADPDIESFELVLAYPVDSVNLSVFRHRRRQTLKAHFSNGNVAFYEIGGWGERAMLWKLWCERLRFLAPYESRTSASETSVGSGLSSVGSVATSLYIVRSSLSVSKAGLPTLWCHYATEQSPQPSTWSDPHLYLGPSFTEKGINFMCLPDVGKKMYQRAIEEAANSKSDSMKLSVEMESLARRAVELWESRRMLRRTHRSYGIWPFPGLHSGLGLWRVSRGQAYTLQTKRCVSEVSLCGPRADFPRVPSNLARTTSFEHLPVPATSTDKVFELEDSKPTAKDSTAFTMCDPVVKVEWNRKQYKRQQRRLSAMRMKSGVCLSWMKARRKTSRLRLNPSSIFENENYTQSSSETLGSVTAPCRRRKNKSILTVKGHPTEGTRENNFKTSSLSHQLMMIDKQLFLSLDTLELSRVRKDMAADRGPNLARLMAFAHRVTCLVASQITAEQDLKARAVLVVRWVGVAYKCHRAHGLQPAESVLRGLQSPAVYRLADTWAYVRRRHASKYRRFEDLCRRYKDPRHPLYLQAYARSQLAVPNLPSAAILVATLTRKLAKLTPATTARFPSESCLSMTNMTESLKQSQKRSKPLARSVHRLVSAFNFNFKTSDINTCTSPSHLHALDSCTLEQNLRIFFTPVTDRLPSDRAMEDVQFFLETHQAAAARYAIPANEQVRACLLLEPASGLAQLFEKSKEVEVPKEE